MPKELNYKNIIENIVSLAQEKLNDWEMEFIANVFNWHILEKKNLGEKQKEIIVKINRKYISQR
jgi:hypothetical protein